MHMGLYRSTDYHLFLPYERLAPPLRQDMATPRGLNPNFLFSCNNGPYATGISENSICHLTVAHRDGRKPLWSLVDCVFVFGFSRCYSISSYSLNNRAFPVFQSKILLHDYYCTGRAKRTISK